jgi:squalene-hopene/tetraprenyl-beta-curcumene cyclase
MRSMKTKLFAAGWATLLGLVIGLSLAPAGEKKVGPDPKTWEAVTQKAAKFLQTTQDKNGGWSTDKTPGVTGIALTGLLRTGQTTAKDPVGEKALQYIESLVDPDKKHIAGKGAKVNLQNYVTSINVMALVEAKQDAKYKAVIGDAVDFLKKLQWDEDDGKTEKDPFFGGAGYDSKSRPDLSNTQMFLDGLKAAGIGPNDPAMKKALKFVNRCQNIKGETNDQPWAKLIGDGSFIYTPALGGATKVVDKALPDGAFPGYGSMTYAGIKSMIYCGVKKDDERITKAYEWIKNNYSVDANPGMPDARAKWGLFYYYNTMAKCLDALGVDYVEDAKGVKHDWRKDITEALAKCQRPDGGFHNTAANWMEADENLVTGYALMALSYCRPK